MKKIRYSYGCDDNQIIKIFAYSPEAEEIAKREAVNGEYEIFDDGQPGNAPTQLDIIEAQVTYTAMMTDTLLEV